jgi:hypothetical protein
MCVARGAEFPFTFENVHLPEGEFVMSNSSRHLARTVCAAALVFGIGGGIAAAQAVVVERAMPAPIVEVAAPGAG